MSDVQALREEYARLRDASEHSAEDFNLAVELQLQARELERTPTNFVEMAKLVANPPKFAATPTADGCTCDKCNGSGQYRNFGKCFKCAGKGVVDSDDESRNTSYWAYQRAGKYYTGKYY